MVSSASFPDDLACMIQNDAGSAPRNLVLFIEVNP